MVGMGSILFQDGQYNSRLKPSETNNNQQP